MPRTRVVVLVVALVALAAVVAAWSFLGQDAPPPDEGTNLGSTAGSDILRGSDIPQGGALPGRLWIVVPATSAGSTCQLRAVDLGALELEPPGELTHCTLVDVSSDGSYAVAYDEDLHLALIDLRERPQRVRGLEPRFRDASGRASRIAALSADGRAVAWCAGVNETVVLSIDNGAARRVAGCDPRFGGDRVLYTRRVEPLEEAILEEGEVVLAGKDFGEGLDLEPDEESSLLAYDVGSTGAVATKVRRVLGAPQRTIQVWQGEQLTSSYRVSGLLPGLESSGLELSPDTTRVALGWPGLLAGVLDFGFDRVGRTADHGSYAWSPDGRWLAIGGATSVSIYARGSDAPTYSLPLTTLMIAWSE